MKSGIQTRVEQLLHPLLACGVKNEVFIQTGIPGLDGLVAAKVACHPTEQFRSSDLKIEIKRDLIKDRIGANRVSLSTDPFHSFLKQERLSIQRSLYGIEGREEFIPGGMGQ